MNGTVGEEDRDKPIDRSLYRYLLEDMARAASEYAVAKQIDADDFEIGILSEALAVVENFRSALIKNWEDKTLNFWESGARPLDKINAGKVPNIDRSTIEIVAGNYLSLPIRSQAFDRILINVLVATELYAFGDEMLNERTFGFPPVSPFKRIHPVLVPRFLRR